jgi:hypothetical protein
MAASFYEVLSAQIRSEIENEFKAQSRTWDLPDAAPKSPVNCLPSDLLMSTLLTSFKNKNPQPRSSGKKYYQRATTQPQPNQNSFISTEPPKKQPERKLTAQQFMALKRFQREGEALSPSSTMKDLQRAFRKIALRIHPDRHPLLPASELNLLAERFRTLCQDYTDLQKPFTEN